VNRRAQGALLLIGCLFGFVKFIDPSDTDSRWSAGNARFHPRQTFHDFSGTHPRELNRHDENHKVEGIIRSHIPSESNNAAGTASSKKLPVTTANLSP